MLELGPKSPSTAAWAVQFFLFLVTLIIYGQWKRKLATVFAVLHQTDGPGSEKGPSESEPEKRALEGAAASDGTVEEPAQAAQPTSLMVWATLILPINLAAWYLTNIAWLEALVGTTDLWQLIFLSLFTFSPVTAALSILFCAFALSLKNTRAEPHKAEKYRVVLRSGMLDGVLLAPAGAVYVAYLYPEQMLKQCGALAAAAMYASQSLVWVYFFRMSRRESQMRGATGMIV